MSCEGKHNNSDFKFCPECGIKLEHEEELVNKLNKLYTEYLAKASEISVDTTIESFVSHYLQKIHNIKPTHDVYFVENKFYTKKQYIDETDDDKLAYIFTSGLFRRSYYTIDNIKKFVTTNIEQRKTDEKTDKIVSDIAENVSNDTKMYFKGIFNNINIIKKNCDKEKIKQIISNYLDSK